MSEHIYNQTLARIAKVHGDKLWLTHEELEPYFGSSPGVQRNMRSADKKRVAEGLEPYFPFPVRPFGKIIGVSVFHVAEYVAYGKVISTGAAEVAPEAPKQPPAPPKQASSPATTPKPAKGFDYTTLLPFWQSSLIFQSDLILDIEAAARTDPETEEPIFSKEDLSDWRERIDTQYGQIAQIEKQILLGELEGFEFPETPWTQL